MGKTATRVAFAGLALLLAFTTFVLAERGNVQRQSFKAFYCAGVAVRERQDPYRVEPLRSCERALEPVQMPSGYVEPAPLPGYVLVPFAGLSALPAKRAAELFAVLLALASILSAICLAEVIPASAPAILLALAPLTLLNVAYGEIPPFAMLAICASAYFLAKQRWGAAGVAVALALIQPNVGLPAALAVFIFAPRSRAAIAISALSLAAISVAGLGITRNLEYFTHVLPLLANAELVASDQYSLSRLLYVIGAGPNLALLIGKIWFVGIAAFGILLAGKLAAGGRNREILPLLPPAAVLLLGIYLHDIQMLIALPVALLIAARARGSALMVLAGVSLALLITVWTQPARPVVVLINAAGVMGGLFAVTQGRMNRRMALAAGGALAAIVVLVSVQHAGPPAAAALVTHNFGALPDEFSPAAWGRYLRATPALTRTVFAPQLATWLGLLGLLVSAAWSVSAATPAQSESRVPRPASEPYSGFSQKYD